MKTIIMSCVLVIISFVLYAQDEAEILGKWYSSEKIDPLTDEKQVNIWSGSLNGDNSLQLFAIRIYSTGIIDILFDLGVFLDSNNYAMQLVYRVDKLETKQVHVDLSTRGNAVFITDSKVFLKDIIDGKLLIIRVKDYQGTPYTASFDISQLKEVLLSKGLDKILD